MYSTCLYCNQKLGANEVIERFPVGRRLAFDAAKGRLWVVCRRCLHWNLTPLEERWEAIEDCERRFRGTTVRASTENVGLAKLREGLELVRVGKPLRPEFAAWRYGESIKRRSRQANLAMAGSMVAASVVAASLAITAPVIISAVPLIPAFAGNIGQVAYTYRRFRRVYARVTDARGREYPVRFLHAYRAEVWPSDDALGWKLHVPLRGGGATLEGQAAVTTLGRLLQATNQVVAKKSWVGDGVKLIEEKGSPERFIADMVQQRTHRRERVRIGFRRQEVSASSLSAWKGPGRLALEMALHEETERVALAGELDALEEAWREAEEIAAIADGLVVAPAISARLAELETGRPAT